MSELQIWLKVGLYLKTMETMALDLEHCSEPWDHPKTMESKALDLENCNDPWDLNDIVPSPIEVKFIYSEKATKFCEIFPLHLSVCIVDKSKGKISQNLNYIYHDILKNLHWLSAKRNRPIVFSIKPKFDYQFFVDLCVLLKSRMWNCVLFWFDLQNWQNNFRFKTCTKYVNEQRFCHQILA